MKFELSSKPSASAISPTRIFVRSYNIRFASVAIRSLISNEGDFPETFFTHFF